MLEFFIIPLIIFIIAIILIVPNYQSWYLNDIDEGFCLAYPAQLVGKGKFPYKDFFYNYGPAKPVLLHILFNYFGTSLKTARLFYSFCPPFLAVEIYFLGFLLIDVPLLPSLLAILYLIHLFPRKGMHYAIPLENGLFSYRMVFGLASIIFMFLYVKYGYGIFPAGFLLGATLVWAQETGVNVLLADGFIILLNIMGWSEIYLFLSGTFILPIVFLVYLLSKGVSIKNILSETCWFILDMFNNIYVSKRVDRYTLPKLMNVAPSSFSFLEFENFLKYNVHKFIFYLRFYVPFAVFFLHILTFCYFYSTGFGYFYFSGSMISYGNMAGLFFFSILHIPMYLSRPDHSYLVRISVPVYPLLGFLLSLCGIYYIWSILILWFLYDLYNGILSYMEEVNGSDKKTYLPMKNAQIYVDREFAKDITDLVSYLQETISEGENILTIPGEPLIYFLSERENASYYQCFLSIYDRDLPQNTVNRLMMNKPKIIIANPSLYTDNFPNGLIGSFDFREFAQPLYEYVTTNYQVIKKIGRYEIMSILQPLK